MKITEPADSGDFSDRLRRQRDIADAVRGAGQDDVISRECHERAQILYQPCDAVDHVPRMADLGDLSVHYRTQLQSLRVRHFGGGDKPRPEQGCAIAIFRPHIRTIVVLQIVADRVVIRDM